MVRRLKLKEVVFWVWLAQGSPEAADRYRMQSKNLCVERVRGGYGAGLSVSLLKEVLVNHLTTQEGKAGLGSGCAQPGRRTGDPDLDTVHQWTEHFKELLNPTNTLSDSPIYLADVAERGTNYRGITLLERRL